MPRHLSTDQKATRVTYAKEHLSRFNHEGGMFLNCIITGDEMWILCTDPVTKAPSKQLKRAGSSPHKKNELKVLLFSDRPSYME